MSVDDGKYSRADAVLFRSDIIVPRTTSFTPSTTPTQKPASVVDLPSIAVFGSVAIDLSCDYSPRDRMQACLSPQLHTSNIAAITESMGGVGHNVALAAQLAGGDTPVRLCSFVADDL